MKKVYALFLSAALVALAATAFAAPQGTPGPAQAQTLGSHRGWQHDQGFGHRLGLSDEQRTKMQAIRDRFRADTRDVRYALMEQRIEVRKLFTDPKADQSALLAKEKEMAALRQKLDERRIQASLEWRSVLTPDQLQKLERMPRGRGMGRGHAMM